MCWFTVKTNHRTMIFQARSVAAARLRALDLILSINGEEIVQVA